MHRKKEPFTPYIEQNYTTSIIIHHHHKSNQKRMNKMFEG